MTFIVSVVPAGSKHKLMLEGQSVQPRRRGKLVSSRMATRTKRHGNKTCTPLVSQSYHCDICDITVNSETQLKQVCVCVDVFSEREREKERESDDAVGAAQTRFIGPP